MNTPTNIVILGAGYAGLLATLRLRGKLDPQHAKITLVNASDTFVERIRLHQVASDQKLRQFSIPKFLRGKPVDFVQGWIIALDPDGQSVEVQTTEGLRHIPYDTLLYTLGSTAQKTAIPGQPKHAYTIGRADQAAALRESLRQSPAGSRVAVIGGGLTGIEAATEIAETYPALNISLWTEGQPGAGLSNKGRAYIEQVFERFGIDLHEGQRVSALYDGAMRLESGADLPYDVAVWAGSFAVSPLAREAGLKVNAQGQIWIDPLMRSVSQPNIFAAGDSAAHVEQPGASIRMGCATAMPMGAHVADNIAAAVKQEALRPFSFAYAVQCISLGRHKGLVQVVNPDDSPHERVLTGRAAALVKESICQYTTWSLRAEALFPGLYRWPGQSKQLAQQPQTAQQT